jgi:hypothetical protein
LLHSFDVNESKAWILVISRIELCCLESGASSLEVSKSFSRLRKYLALKSSRRIAKALM